MFGNFTLTCRKCGNPVIYDSKSAARNVAMFLFTGPLGAMGSEAYHCRSCDKWFNNIAKAIRRGEVIKRINPSQVVIVAQP